MISTPRASAGPARGPGRPSAPPSRRVMMPSLGPIRRRRPRRLRTSSGRPASPPRRRDPIASGSTCVPPSRCKRPVIPPPRSSTPPPTRLGPPPNPSRSHGRNAPRPLPRRGEPHGGWFGVARGTDGRVDHRGQPGAARSARFLPGPDQWTGTRRRDLAGARGRPPQHPCASRGPSDWNGMRGRIKDARSSIPRSRPRE